MMKILVSACLMGRNCKYNGGNNRNEKVIRFADHHEVYEVCPEVLGGLPTPRIPCEIVDGVVYNRDGTSCDQEYHLGAQMALEIAQNNQIDLAILKSRSPSCGVYQVYDGTFSGTLRDGKGVFAQLMISNGFHVLDVEELDNILSED